ncbi:glyoxalase superfamily protein [Cellulomonas telluris]|uniref:glyoxalase superfamily protein n=1 Tax=Cellulomonas telluris TaxID=2306636 RepID=UPI0010A796AD|nr:glyoxalase superfamily protein [Cellulomonas telluris]
MTTHPLPTPDRAKAMARALRADLAADGLAVTHSRALELVAHAYGLRDWNALAAAGPVAATGAVPPPGGPAGVGPAVPVLRVADAPTAYAFYLDVLGCRLDWEHRFEPGLPVYAQVTRGDLRLHLSEHPGDGGYGAVLWVPVADVAALVAQVRERTGGRQRPAVDLDAPGGPTAEVLDPFGNRLRLCTPAP